MRSIEGLRFRRRLTLSNDSITLQVYTDPVTGEKKTKQTLGGSYPGNRRTPQQQYAPSAAEFQNGQATAHFVNYGGGNALVLQQNGIAQPQAGQPIGKQPTFIQGRLVVIFEIHSLYDSSRRRWMFLTLYGFVTVTLPNNVHGGDKIHVRAPDGRLNEIIVPQGFGPGSTFTVEFADAPPPKTDTLYHAPVAQATPATSPMPYTPYTPYTAPVAHATPAAVPYGNHQNHSGQNDDGFATGFNNPHFVPTAQAQAHGGDAEIDLSSYPTTTAKPVVY